MLSMWNLYCRDERGNFGIMFSVIVGMLILGAAVVIETSRMYGQKAVMQDMADTAALSGAYIAKTDIQGRDEAVRQNIKFHQDYVPDQGLATNATVDFDDVNEQVTVTIPRSFPSFFSGILGREDIVVAASTTVSYKSEAVDPVSIAFALDVSGSMGDSTNSGAVKIDVLKQSTKLLFDELEEASERPELLQDSVRTGMTAYNTEVVSTEDMRWGWQHLENSVDALIANGGTNSTPALSNAYDQITYDRTVRKSLDPKFELDKLREYVVFMTDGYNQGSNEDLWNEESKALCETMRADGIEIYSIAFAAPEKGQILLLDCASWNSGQAPEEEYDDDDDDENGNNGNGNGNDNVDKCLNNGANETGKALGLCKKKEDKSKYFFDAEDAAAFKEAFESIGKEIAQNTIRITG